MSVSVFVWVWCFFFVVFCWVGCVFVLGGGSFGGVASCAADV